MYPSIEAYDDKGDERDQVDNSHGDALYKLDQIHLCHQLELADYGFLSRLDEYLNNYKWNDAGFLTSINLHDINELIN